MIDYCFSPDDVKLLTYNALDSAITLQVMESFWSEVRSKGHEFTYERTIDMLNPLMALMVRGIRVDSAALKETQIDTDRQIELKQADLNAACGRPINANSPKQVYDYFYVDKRITPYKNGKGKPTTDDKALTRIARGTASRKGYPEARIIQEVRGLRKLKGTYLDMAFDEDGRFRTSCNPRGTTTGRISTSKTIYDTGMNMQNLPEVFKHFLVPDPGYMMVEMDKAQAEWVVVAYESCDEGMIRIIEEGGDCHAHTASLMFGASKELVDADKKLCGHHTDPFILEQLRKEYLPEIFELPFVPRIFSLRQAGKKSNHALNYDETYKRFALENEMAEKESKVITEAYHRIYPGIRKNFDRIQTQLRKDRTLVNCFGRARTFLEKWGQDLFKQAYAYKPQSTVADIINDALVLTYEDPDPRMDYLELLAQVHDSIIFQLPLSMPTEDMVFCLNQVERHMNPAMEYWGRSFTIGTDIKMGTCSWGTIPEFDLANEEELRKEIDGYKQQQTRREEEGRVL